MGSKVFGLTAWDRLTLYDIAGRQKVDARSMRKAITLMDALELTDDEKASVGYADDGHGTITWTDTEKRFDVSLEGNALAMLIEWIKAHQWPMLSVKNAMKLCEVLGIEVE